MKSHDTTADSYSTFISLTVLELLFCSDPVTRLCALESSKMLIKFSRPQTRRSDKQHEKKPLKGWAPNLKCLDCWSQTSRTVSSQQTWTETKKVYRTLGSVVPKETSPYGSVTLQKPADPLDKLYVLFCTCRKTKAAAVVCLIWIFLISKLCVLHLKQVDKSADKPEWDFILCSLSAT